MTRKITLLYVDSGGGHRAAATALCEQIRTQRRPWEVEMTCIQDILDSVDFIQRYTGIRFQDVYNIMLRRGWTGGSAQLIRLMHSVIRLTHGSQVRAMRQYWKQARPDLVVSLIPHFNRAITEALDGVWPGTPYVTLLTDLADYPPHFWMERPASPRTGGYFICGTERAAAQATDLGIRPDHVFRTSGMILHPRFYLPLNVDRRAERLRLPLQPDVPTGLVLFGGEGSGEMVNIAKALNEAKMPIQLIVLCGRNARVAARIRNMEQRIPMFVEGFTRDIPFYMELADFFIGKPGPGSISEALAKRLPVIVARNAFTMAHERYNADWIKERGAGLVVRDFSTEIAGAAATLIAPQNYARFRQGAENIRNRAVFEIPDILEKVLSEAIHETPRAQTAA